MDKNKHILSDAVSDMPYYKPDDSVLERLESNLFEFPVIDMPSYSPDENLWGKIEVSAKNLDKTRKYWRRSLILSLLLLLGLIFGHVISNHQPRYLDQIKTKNDDNLINWDNNKTDIKSGVYNKSENSSMSDELELKHKPEPIINKISAKENIVEDVVSMNNLCAEKPEISHQSECSINSLNMRNSGVVSGMEYQVSLKEKSIMRHHMTDTDCSEFTGSLGYFSMGISGDYFSIREKDELDNIHEYDWYSVNAILKYSRNRLYLGAGIGISLSSDYSKLDYTYLQNELVNTYTNVDSMYYDPITGTTEFYTVIVEVWDSVEYRQQDMVQNKYQYIQIPIFVGCEILKRRVFGLGLSAGVTYTQLIQKTNNSPSLYIENGRITDLNYSTVDRRENLFRFDLQLDFRISFSRRIYTLISPSASFFNNSLYNDNIRQSMISPGIRCGFYYDFNY